MADGELSLIDKNITSLLEIPLSPRIRSLNLHCNRISKIEGLTAAWHVLQLDLSSNKIRRIEGLGALTSLRTLNLSCNLISKVEGLQGLVNLVKLNLSYNQISDLTGLLYLHGTDYKLKHLHLQCNRVNSINQMLQCMLGLQSLSSLMLSMDGNGNPVCATPGYRDLVLQSLPQLSSLDGVDRQGNPALPVDETAVDILAIEDLAEFLLSDCSVNNEKSTADVMLPAPGVDEELVRFRRKMGVVAADRAPGGEAEVGQRRSPQGKALGSRNVLNELRIRRLEEQVYELFHKGPSSPSSSSLAPTMVEAQRDMPRASDSDTDSRQENNPKGSARRPRGLTHRAGSSGVRKRSSMQTKGPRSERKVETSTTTLKLAGKKTDVQSSSQHLQRATPHRTGVKLAPGSNDGQVTAQVEENTYRAIVEERDQERERRWEAEQEARKLTEELRNLQTRASEEKDLQNLALHTTDRLKELLLKERSARVELQRTVEEMRESQRASEQKLAQSYTREEDQQRALRSLRDAAAQGEALRDEQQAQQMKKNQELESKASALKREVEILRALARQRKDKLQQLHDLLASKEQAHRKELETRLLPGGPEFQDAVARAVASMEQRHSQQLVDLREKVAAGDRRYADLEDEFRTALTIEASRFAEVKEAAEIQAAELLECRDALAQCQQKEQRSASLFPELTAMVKEQKARIAELVKSKREREAEMKARIRSLEEAAGQDKRRAVQLELLKQDKSKLLSQLAAQETVIEGLRAERRIWGQELAQQGASLAQDRGRLEARIEVLGTELQTLKKQAESDTNALKIKAKVVEDQTDTIRKLKEALQERDAQIQRLREESAQAQRRFQDRLEEELAPLSELRERAEQLGVRKEELRVQLEDREAEVEELKREHSVMNRKWQEKAGLLTHLETQVRRMKENFDAKEKTLLQEKEKAQQAHRGAVEKLRCVDDAFRRQMEAVQASHQAELLQLASEKQKQIELANQRVLQVEEEMRQLLEETECKRRTMDEKMKRLTSVLKDF